MVLTVVVVGFAVVVVVLTVVVVGFAVVVVVLIVVVVGFAVVVVVVTVVVALFSPILIYPLTQLLIAYSVISSISAFSLTALYQYSLFVNRSVVALLSSVSAGVETYLNVIG